MSNFLLVLPEGWTRIDLEQATQISGFSIPAINNYISSFYLETMCIELMNGGMLPEGSVILEAQLINDEIFVVRLG